MPAKTMKQIAFDIGFLTALSLLGELDWGVMAMGVSLKSDQPMGKRSRIENEERMRLVSGTEWRSYTLIGASFKIDLTKHWRTVKGETARARRKKLPEQSPTLTSQFRSLRLIRR
jgi:hypothetical protein